MQRVQEGGLESKDEEGGLALYFSVCLFILLLRNRGGGV